MRVLFDLTYASRGKSGIPGDTRALAQALSQLEGSELEYLVSLPGFVSKSKVFQGKSIAWEANKTG